MLEEENRILLSDNPSGCYIYSGSTVVFNAFVFSFYSRAYEVLLLNEIV